MNKNTTYFENGIPHDTYKFKVRNMMKRFAYNLALCYNRLAFWRKFSKTPKVKQRSEPVSEAEEIELKKIGKVWCATEKNYNRKLLIREASPMMVTDSLVRLCFRVSSHSDTPSDLN